VVARDTERPLGRAAGTGSRGRTRQRRHHLHDSVLQTLTLIERAAGDEAAVIRLARTQERELRNALQPEGTGDASSFLSDLRALEDEIENDYGVRVELVVVGDCVSDERVTALVAAGREAAINAAGGLGGADIDLRRSGRDNAQPLRARPRFRL